MIIQHDGLLSDSELTRRGIQPTIIGYEHIKSRRMSITIPCGPRGVIADYVPLYFGPRSPMLYVISQGGVPGYASDQREIIHLVASAEAICSAGLGYVFTDGHAVIAMTSFFDDLAFLNRIDWPLMEARYWHDTLEDGDRKRRRQAEFLIHQFLPWDQISEIGVITTKIQRDVQASIASVSHQPPVNVYRTWYY